MSQTDVSANGYDTQFENHPKVKQKKKNLPWPRGLKYKWSACVSSTVRAVAVFLRLGEFKWHLVFLKRIT